jgi:phosphotransferase system IIB component
VVREGVGAGGEMTQALYAHMNNKIFKKKNVIGVLKEIRLNIQIVFGNIDIFIILIL